MMGLALIDIYESATGEAYPLNTRFDWMDPGILATIGSASLLGGVTRLTVASTVIVVYDYVICIYYFTERFHSVPKILMHSSLERISI